MDLTASELKRANIVVGGKYHLKEILGQGSFGKIFRASVKGSEAMVAVKVEKRNNQAGYATLTREAKVLTDVDGKPGFPTLYAFGKEDEYNFMVTSLLGLNLEKLFRLCGGIFSLKTVLMLADQLLTRIETLHGANYLHRDIKPENFVMGLSSSSKNLFLIDFGLSRQYRNAEGVHIRLSENKGLIGTARYASINAHLGVEQSRRDDLEAIGYVLIYFLKGKLPWQNLPVTNKKEKYAMISDMKMNTPLEVLCEDLPKEFLTFLTYVKGLMFDETPNYKYLKKLFRKLFVESGYDFDYSYDWNVLNIAHPTILPHNKNGAVVEFKSRMQARKSMPFGRPKLFDCNSPPSKKNLDSEEDKWSGSEEIPNEPTNSRNMRTRTQKEISWSPKVHSINSPKRLEASSMNNTSKIMHWSGLKLIKSDEDEQMPDGPVELHHVNSCKSEESTVFYNLQSSKFRENSPEPSFEKRYSDRTYKKVASAKNLSQPFSRQSLFGRFISLKQVKCKSEAKVKDDGPGKLYC